MICGIDPGMTGAVAWYYEAGNSAGWGRMPTIGMGGSKRSIDPPGLARLLNSLRAMVPIRLVVIEKVGAMPGQGVTSMFSFGRGCGVLDGVCGALGLPIVMVTPQSWKKRILEGLPHDKAGAIAYCQRRWPQVNLIPENGRVPHSGAADALCLAAYGKFVL